MSKSISNIPFRRSNTKRPVNGTISAPGTPVPPSGPPRCPVLPHVRELAQRIDHMQDAMTDLMVDASIENQDAFDRIEEALQAADMRFEAAASRQDRAEDRADDADDRLDRAMDSTDARFERMENEISLVYKRAERWHRITATAGGVLCLMGLTANEFPVVSLLGLLLGGTPGVPGN